MIRKISLLCLVLAALTGHSQVPLVGSTARITTSLNGTFFAGESAYSTVQAAVNAAGTTGSVTILPSYGGTDQWTNPNNIKITDLRPLTNVQSGLRDVYASDFGAKCNGSADDTPSVLMAISTTNAFNTVINAKTQYQIHMPSGSCQITASLIFGVYGSLVGEGGGTYLIARYDAWTGGSDHALIEVTTNGPMPGGSTAAPRAFGHMTIFGVGDGSIPDAEAVKVWNQANVYDPSRYTFGQISFENMQVSQFDTAFDLQDIVNSQFSFVWVNQVREAFNLNGDAVQIFFSHVYAQTASWIGTSNHGTSFGLHIQPNDKYSANCATHTQYCAPQGIYFHHSAIVAFDDDIDLEQGVGTVIDHNTIDVGAGGPIGFGASILLGPFALGGGVWIESNYIGTASSNTNLIYVEASSFGGGIDGLWIQNNHFLTDPGGVAGTTLGIAFAGSTQLQQVHIVGNNFHNVNVGIASGQSLLQSEIRGNGGDTIGSYLINLDTTGAAPDYSGTVIDANTDENSVPVIHVGTATGATIGFNFSGDQVTGTQIATGTGCSFTVGAGNSCSVTMTIPHQYADAGYTIGACTATGGTGINGLVPATPTVGGVFSANEVGLNASAAGGGTLSCIVNHGAN